MFVFVFFGTNIFVGKTKSYFLISGCFGYQIDRKLNQLKGDEISYELWGEKW